MKSFLLSLISFNGRIGRRRFAFNIAVTWLPLIALALLGDSGVRPPSWVGAIIVTLGIPVLIFFMVGTVASYTRRCHDLGWSGMRIFFNLIPFVGPITNIFIIFSSGQKKANEWGEPPTRF